MTKQITVELPDGVTLTQKGTSYSYHVDLHLPSPEAAAELIERVKAAKEKAVRPAGMPENGQDYCCITTAGFCELRIGGVDEAMDECLAEIGNVFLTEAECLAEIERRKALQRVRQWIAENTEPFEPDWNNDDQPKYMVYFSHKEKKLSITVEWIAQYFNGIAWFASKEDVERLIAACEADLRVLAGVE